MPANVGALSPPQLLGDAFVRVLNGDNVTGEPDGVIGLCKDHKASLQELAQYEHGYVRQNRHLERAWIEPTDSDRKALRSVLRCMHPLLDALEERDAPRTACDLSLLCCIVAEYVGGGASPFWDRAMRLYCHKLRGVFPSAHFFYKVAGDIYTGLVAADPESAGGEIRVISYTPLLFLPQERASWCRIRAYRAMLQYVRCGRSDLRYLFCDETTRRRVYELEQSGELRREQKLAMVQQLRALLSGRRGGQEDGGHVVQLRRFVRAYGLRSMVLGPTKGIIQEGAETREGRPEYERQVFVRQISGTELEVEIRAFDDLFDSRRAPLGARDVVAVDQQYLKMLEADPYSYLVARNRGVYSPEQQARLRVGGAREGSSEVCIIGLGCVGGLVAHALARIGVDQFRLVDGDVFEPENINRQPFAGCSSVGQSKALVTERGIRDINPYARVTVHTEAFCEANAQSILGQARIVAQCVDSMGARRVLHDVARQLQRPVVTMSGQPPYRGFVSTLLPDCPHSFEELMQLPVGTQVMEDLRIERATAAIERVKTMAHDGERAEMMANWLADFKNNSAGWAVTFERTWLMGILIAHEIVRFLALGPEKLLAAAPRAIIIDLDHSPEIVQIMTPDDARRQRPELVKQTAGGEWLWDFRQF